ncbi:uncharacterized protein [Watersipora subatra]|uniref:uncharacterized protein n=1 Tax=Watersipora subatra TaxID=2589382 RepID=UPI00355AF1D8
MIGIVTVILVNIYEENAPVLQILCLHGYRQNADVFHVKTGAFRSAMKKHADFVLIDAPHALEENTIDASGNPQALRTWWFKDKHVLESGIQRSIEHIKATIIKQGPFHGILGFSQGASMAVTYSAQMSLKEHGAASSISFMLLVAGFINQYHNELVTIWTSLDSGGWKEAQLLDEQSVQQLPAVNAREHPEFIDSAIDQQVLLSDAKQQQVLFSNAKEQKMLFSNAKEQQVLLNSMKEHQVSLDDARGQQVLLDDGKEHQVSLDDARKQQVLLDDGKEHQVLHNHAKEQRVLLDGAKEQLASNDSAKEQQVFSGYLNERQELPDIAREQQKLGDIANEKHAYASLEKSKLLLGDIKCLLAIGETDNVLPKERSEEVIGHFSNMQVLYHPGGHGIPLKSVQKKAFNKYMEECKELCFSSPKLTTAS